MIYLRIKEYNSISARCQDKKLNWQSIGNHSFRIRNCEKYQAIKENKLSKHIKKWFCEDSESNKQIYHSCVAN